MIYILSYQSIYFTLWSMQRTKNTVLTCQSNGGLITSDHCASCVKILPIQSNTGRERRGYGKIIKGHACIVVGIEWVDRKKSLVLCK